MSDAARRGPVPDGEDATDATDAGSGAGPDAAVDGADPAPDGAPPSPSWRRDRALLAVAALAGLALLARLVLLGARPAHFDEGRVAYWTLEYLRTGSFHYRYIIHGPLVQHVVRPLFALFGPSDLLARLPVALLGGLLPLSALLYRRHLSDVETVALATFLAFNPVLLYYSRFFRSTLLVAGFAFVGFGLLVRLFDERRSRYLYAFAVVLALAFGAKENAAVYVLCWLGAGALLADHALFRPRGFESGLDRLRALVDRPGGGDPDLAAARWLGRVGLALGAFLVVSLFLYAPRAPADGVGLWAALAEPWRLPALVEATVDDVAVGYGYWFGGSAEPGCNRESLVAGYVCYLGRFLGTLGTYAAPLSALAVLGFLRERYAAAAPRSVVVAASYWGFVSVLGYPLGTDIWGAWIVVNALVPLAIPAAVGAGVLVETGRDTLAAGDVTAAGLAAAVLLVGAGWSGVAVVDDVYRHPTAADNDLVQYAQPSAELRAAVAAMDARVDEGPGTDVLVYGSVLVDGDGTAARRPACVKWFDALPLPWYTEAAEADVACATGPGDVPADPPPVVVADASAVSDLGDRFAGYERRELRLRTTSREVVFLLAPREGGERATRVGASPEARATRVGASPDERATRVGASPEERATRVGASPEARAASRANPADRGAVGPAGGASPSSA
jgi:uncharacterized protein (TIGR03663 family)